MPDHDCQDNAAFSVGAPQTDLPRVKGRISAATRFVRVVALLVVLVGAIFAARMFVPSSMDEGVRNTALGRGGSRVPAGRATERGTATIPPQPTGIGTAESQADAVSRLLGEIGRGGGSNDQSAAIDIAMPAGSTRVWITAAAGSTTAVYRSAQSLADLAAYFRTALSADGWKSEPLSVGENSERWFGRFTRGRRACMVLCTRPVDRSETMIVVETMEAGAAPR